MKGPPLSPYHGSQMSKVEVSLAPVVAIVLMCRPTPGPGLARSALHEVTSSCSCPSRLAPPVSGTALQKAGQKTPTRNSPVTKDGNTLQFYKLSGST